MDNENKNPLTPEEESTPAQEAIEPAGPESPAAEIPAEETQTASEPTARRGRPLRRKRPHPARTQRMGNRPCRTNRSLPKRSPPCRRRIQKSRKSQRSRRKIATKGNTAGFPLANDRRLPGGGHPSQRGRQPVGGALSLHEPGPHRGPCQHPFGQRGGNRLQRAEPNHHLHHGERGYRKIRYPVGRIWD